MKSSPAMLIDSNVLIYAAYPDEPHFAASRALIDSAKDPQANFFVAPQNVAEFYGTVTNPRRVTKSKTPLEALEAIETFLAFPGVTMLAVPVNVVSLLTELLRVSQVTAQDVYDAQLVAVMLGNEVTTILTFNDADFRRFPGITVTIPTV